MFLLNLIYLSQSSHISASRGKTLDQYCHHYNTICNVSNSVITATYRWSPNFISNITQI